MNVLIINPSGRPFKSGIKGYNYLFDPTGRLKSGMTTVKWVPPGGMLGGEQFDLIIIEMHSQWRNDRFNTWVQEAVVCRLAPAGVLIDL